MSPSAPRRVLIAALTVIACLAVGAASASAGVVSVDNATRTLLYTGDDGPNHIDVFVYLNSDGVYEVEVRDLDGKSTTSSPRDCEVDSVDDVTCYLSYPPTQRLLLGAGDDSGQVADRYNPTGNVVDGGEGNDEVEGSSGADTLIGGPGDDNLASDGGPNLGVPLPVGPGDVLIGGDGTDTADYFDGGGDSARLSNNGVADDGAPGENDNIMTDVENIRGLQYKSTTMIGNDGPNRMVGYSGNDTLIGNGGNDTLEGGDANDTLDGGAGDDMLTGGAEDDTLTGGPGIDSITGDFSGGYDQTITGNDRILARDGTADTISCGPGADSAQVDAIDTIAGDSANGCESVDRAAPVAKPAVATLRSTALLAKSARVPVTIACQAGGALCLGTVRIVTPTKVTIKGKRLIVTIASGSYTVKPGKALTVSLRIGTNGKLLVARAKTRRVRMELRPKAAKKAIVKVVTLRR